jgi:hypothetical protein
MLSCSPLGGTFHRPPSPSEVITLRGIITLNPRRKATQRPNHVTSKGPGVVARFEPLFGLLSRFEPLLSRVRTLPSAA